MQESVHNFTPSEQHLLKNEGRKTRSRGGDSSPLPVHSLGPNRQALTLCTTTYNCVPVVVEVVARRVKVQQEGGSLRPFMGSDLGLYVPIKRSFGTVGLYKPNARLGAQSPTTSSTDTPPPPELSTTLLVTGDLREPFDRPPVGYHVVGKEP